MDTCILGQKVEKSNTLTDPGLSYGHISPHGVAEFWKGAKLVKVSKPKIFYAGQYGGGGRGGISKFTRQSRGRLLRKLASILVEYLPVFLTLTYPAEFPSDAEVWKRHLDNFAKRLMRRFPKAGFIWKLEPQKRGAPHYHLMVWGVDYAHLLFWAGKSWYQVVGSGDEKHLRAGTRVEKIRSWRGVMSYASKYMAKVEELPEGWNKPGRFWGTRGNIPFAEIERISLSDYQVNQFLRLLRRYMKLPGRQYKSLSCITTADFWLNNLDRYT